MKRLRSIVKFTHFFVPSGEVGNFGGGQRHEMCGFIFTTGRLCHWPADEHPSTEEELRQLFDRGGYIYDDGSGPGRNSRGWRYDHTVGRFVRKDSQTDERPLP